MPLLNRNRHDIARLPVAQQSNYHNITSVNPFRVIQTSDCNVICFDRQMNDNKIRTIEENAFLRIDTRNL